MDPFRDLGLALSNWTIKYVPDAWVIAIILSVIVFVMALIWGDITPVGAITAWGKGFWTLLSFMAQVSFGIVVAYACAAAPIVSRSLDYLGSRTNPDKPWQAVLFLCLFSCFTAWVNYAITLIMSAMLVPYLAKHNPKTDYRLLAASAYVGLGTMWHSGLSGSATLIVATPDNFLIKAKVISELISVDRTIFSTFNWILIGVAVLVVCLVFPLLTPRPEKAFTKSKEELDEMFAVTKVDKPERMTTAQRLNWWPGWNILAGSACVIYMFLAFRTSGWSAWTIDMYNLVFLTLALFLTWRPVIFLSGCKKGVMGAWGILVQFPFYGGIFGLVSYTNLGHFLTSVFTSIANEKTFLPIVYVYSGVLSYFVPSGGSKWAIEAPYLIPAAKAFNTSAASVTLVYGWGDMMTHLLQPFWAIPVLDITKTSFGQLAGFWALLFFIYAFVMTAIMFFAPVGL
ncbi:MAG TPA: TIGR00366 family protein [Selenomonadales bacterium]|nr:TIGR00366 family protein [Selenomonadales bacterium]